VSSNSLILDFPSHSDSHSDLLPSSTFDSIVRLSVPFAAAAAVAEAVAAFDTIVATPSPPHFFLSFFAPAHGSGGEGKWGEEVGGEILSP
jgi:hypothetical protein